MDPMQKLVGRGCEFNRGNLRILRSVYPVNDLATGSISVVGCLLKVPLGGARFDEGGLSHCRVSLKADVSL